MKLSLSPAKLLLAAMSLSLVSLPLAAQENQTPINQPEEQGQVDDQISVDQADQEEYEHEQQARNEKQDKQKEELAGPMEDVNESVTVLNQMQQDPDMRKLLDKAKGVFIVPDYAAASLIVGGSGGEGVLLTRTDNEWSNPVFYDIGSISAGLQAGAAAGSMAWVLMNDNAVDSFKKENNFSLTADAGFSIINWSARARGDVSDNDVIVWTDTEGLLGELSVGVTDVNLDDEENQEYYGQEVTAQAILSGEVKNPHQEEIQQALREQTQ